MERKAIDDVIAGIEDLRSLVELVMMKGSLCSTMKTTKNPSWTRSEDTNLVRSD